MFFKSKRIKELERKVEILEKKIVRSSDLESFEKRLSRQELMHTEIFKKQNDLFDSAMKTIVAEAGNTIRHIMNLAKQEVEKTESEEDEKIPPEKQEYVVVIVNGQPTQAIKGELNYEAALELAYGPNYSRELEFLVAYRDGDGEIPDGNLILGSEPAILKTGTVVNVTVIKGNSN